MKVTKTIQDSEWFNTMKNLIFLGRGIPDPEGGVSTYYLACDPKFANDLCYLPHFNIKLI